MLPQLTLYGRTGCHLCEEAAVNLRRLNFDFREVNIADNADLEEQYGFDIPVLTLGDRFLMKGVLSQGRLGSLKLLLLREISQG